jgi:hypothetical protein
VFGPVFTGYAQWVVEEAAAAGAERLLFLMREGKLLKELIDRARPSSGFHPRMRALWISREACARASIYQGSSEEIRTFLDRLRPPTPSQLIESLGLEAVDIPDLEELESQFSLSSHRDELANAFIESILEQPQLIAKMVQRSAARRTLLKEYLIRTAGPGSGPVGLVDVGWSGSIQESLQAMFSSDGDPLQFQGLYLLAHVGSSDRVLRGVRLKGYLGTVGTDPFDVAAITGGAEIIELISTCPEGSLLEIAADGEPLLAQPAGDERESSNRALVQRGIRSYQDAWLECHPEAGPFFETTEAGANLLTRIVKRFVSQPNHDEAVAFTWWTHEENYGSEGTEQLVPPRYLPTIRYRSAEDLHWAPMSDLHWTGGASALVDNEMSDAIFQMREGTMDPGRFSSPVLGEARLQPFTGEPGDAELPIVGIPIVQNRYGLSLIEWRGPVERMRQLVLWPAPSFYLLRIDRLEVVDASSPAHEVELFCWTAGDDRNRLVSDNVRWVTSQVMGVENSSTLTIDFDGPLSTREVRVLMAGAYLPPPPSVPDGYLPGDPEAEVVALRQEIEAIYQTKLLRLAAYPRRMYGAARRVMRRSGTGSSAGGEGHDG